MFKIVGDTIHITRGDRGVIELTTDDDYTFSIGDTIELRVYEKKSLNELPVLSKMVEVTEEVVSIDIKLSAEDTKIGEIENKIKEYWYEIELNNQNTMIGYDENGAKLFVLYPEGRKLNDTSKT